MKLHFFYFAANKPTLYPYTGPSPLTTPQLFGTPGARSALKDMTFSPFFSPYVFGNDGQTGFTPRGLTPHTMTPYSLSQPTPSMRLAPEGILSTAKKNRKGPSPRVVFKDQLVQPKSAESSQPNAMVRTDSAIFVCAFTCLFLILVLLFVYSKRITMSGLRLGRPFQQMQRWSRDQDLLVVVQSRARTCWNVSREVHALSLVCHCQCIHIAHFTIILCSIGKLAQEGDPCDAQDSRQYEKENRFVSPSH